MYLDRVIVADDPLLNISMENLNDPKIEKLAASKTSRSAIAMSKRAPID